MIIRIKMILKKYSCVKWSAVAGDGNFDFGKLLNQ